MLTQEKATEVLAGIGEWREEHLDEPLTESDLISWLPEFGVAVSVHGEDVDFVEDYYRYLLEEAVLACTGGQVVVSDVRLVRDEDDEYGYEYLHFRRDGRSVWWHVEHESDDYVDQAAVSEQLNDLDPGGADPRMFHEVIRTKKEVCADDVYVLASPQQARALSDEFGLDFHRMETSTSRPNHREQPTAAPDTVEWYAQQDRRSMSGTAKGFLDRWLSEMDGALGEWRTRFQPEGVRFDFSLGSLDALERLVLDRYANWSAVQAAADDPFVVGAVRYLGETLIGNSAARWCYRDGNDSMHSELPLIRSNTPTAFQENVVPLYVLSRVAEDRGTDSLAGSVEALHHAVDEYARAQRLLSLPAGSDHGA